MRSNAIVLFAHGARDPEWAHPLELVRDQLRSEGMRTELAYLEIMKPTLEAAARALAADGIETVTIVPLFLAQGKHLKRDLPAMVAAIERSHPGVKFRVTPALGEEPEILAAITAWVKRSAG